MAGASELSAQLIGRVPGLSEASDQVEVRLDQMLLEVREAWPSWIEESAFVAHVGELIAQAEAPSESLANLNAADVYLAAAAALRSAPGCATVEEKIRRLAKSVVMRMGGDEATAAETASEVVEKLLVGSRERAGQIADYKGRGSLNGWLRATLSRTYLNAKRKQKREVLIGDEAVLEALDDDHSDPAMLHMKSQYREEFAAAFEGAIASLTDRQRGVLRYRFVDGATVDAIAKVYRTHRATTHRWISDARAALAKETEKLLRVRLAVNNVELDAIRAMIESQLELSLSRMFGKH